MILPLFKNAPIAKYFKGYFIITQRNHFFFKKKAKRFLKIKTATLFLKIVNNKKNKAI